MSYPVENKYIPILKVISILGSLFFIGIFSGLNFAPLFSGKLFAVMAITIVPLLIFVALLVAGYMAVGYVINYYFKQLDYWKRIVLTLSGMIALLTGFFIASSYV